MVIETELFVLGRHAEAMFASTSVLSSGSLHAVVKLLLGL